MLLACLLLLLLPPPPPPLPLACCCCLPDAAAAYDAGITFSYLKHFVCFQCGHRTPIQCFVWSPTGICTRALFLQQLACCSRTYATI
jgi:hypothetical protein